MNILTMDILDNEHMMSAICKSSLNYF